MLAEARQGAAQAGNFDVDEAAKETDAGTAEACRGGHETILVVEDAGTIRRMVVNMLESLGYAVRQAEDGRAALEILTRPGKIDLLFTDMVLPQGMMPGPVRPGARLSARSQGALHVGLFAAFWRCRRLAARAASQQAVPQGQARRSGAHPTRR